MRLSHLWSHSGRELEIAAGTESEAKVTGE